MTPFDSRTLLAGRRPPAAPTPSGTAGNAPAEEPRVCHGPARGHALSLGQPAVPRLPTIEVGKRDVSLEAHSIQDLEELADVAMLWDVRDRATAEESRRESDG